MFEFPFPYEDGVDTFETGSIEKSTRKVITYEGDAEIGFTIIIHALGTVENISIYNLDTREELHIDTDKLKSMTGSVMIYGDTITITTIKGSKQAHLLRNGEYTNILNCLGKTPAWFQLSKGDNLFGYAAEVGEEYLDFMIESRLAYEGV
jgi:hypothetical protein